MHTIFENRIENITIHINNDLFVKGLLLKIETLRLLYPIIRNLLNTHLILCALKVRYSYMGLRGANCTKVKRQRENGKLVV